METGRGKGKCHRLSISGGGMSGGELSGGICPGGMSWEGIGVYVLW